ncbi:hypothetical protein VQ643_01720 [Pseudomonas sp. F1_0610]|uniref:type IV pilus modification PilV family protein n=1 Tax=Pseudomonas sp. F1_0610 TaxID=3114284 RepID=UPI0039C32FCF
MERSVEGFSLLEVLISLVLLNTAIFGLFGAQVKALQAATDAGFRQTAIELSQHYIEMLKVEAANGSSKPSLASYQRWLARVKQLLPVDDDLLKTHFIICFSSSPLTCDGKGQILTLQLAWYSPNSSCSSHIKENICLYNIRTPL